MNKVNSLLIPLLLIGVTLLVFLPARDYDFVWDDHINITDNPYLNPPTFSRVLSFWQQPYEGLYVPLTYTVWGIIARFADSVSPGHGQVRLRPSPFHVANLALHLFSVLVMFAILRSLVKQDWAAAGGAWLFAVHPIQVEPVIWVTGMKDLLSGLLSLAAIALYLRYAGSVAFTRTLSQDKRKKQGETPPVFHPKRDYILGTAAFVLALLAKPSAVVTPLIAGALDYWMLKRPFRQCAGALAWWIVLALPFVVLTKWQQPSVVMDGVPPFWARPLVAGDAVAFYLHKLLLPLDLAVDYGRTPAYVLRQGWVYAAWLLPLGIAVLAWRWKDRRPWVVASLAVFLAGILPVLGFVPFWFQRFSTVADRYLYLSMLGPALMVSSILSEVMRRWFFNCIFIVLGFLSIAAVFQTRVWRDNGTLFAHVLRINISSPMAHNNLGGALALGGLTDEALIHYREALRLKPDYEDAHNNWGVVLLKLGRIDEAVEHLQAALRINDSYAEAHYNLGNALAKKGEWNGAIVHFEEAVRLSPTYTGAYNNLANALARQGKLDEAVEHYRSALRLNPAWAEAHYNLAMALGKKGELEGAVSHLQEAARLQPELAAAHEALGRILTLQGRREEAVHHLEKAVQILKANPVEAGKILPDRLSPQSSSYMKARTQ